MIRKKMYTVTFGLLLFSLVLSLSTDAALASETPFSPENNKAFKLFKNPVVGDGADPWIVKHTDGYYYYTQTTGNNITVRKSKTLSDLDHSEKKVVWTPKPTDPNSQHMWAPELHFLDGKWYIYYAASDGDMGKQQMYVLESENSDPLSSYSYPEGTEFGKIADPSDKWAIDGTILEYNSQRYFVWSGWEGDKNVSQQIYIAPMKNPWTISGDRIELSRPELEWEKKGTPLINEGPQILKNKLGHVFIVYSASGSWTDDYCLGMLTLTGQNPLNASSWTKNQQPVFQSNPEAHVYGPGHNSFVKSPDGKQDWIVYHAAKFKGAGWNRNVRMQKFLWNSDGTPNFGVPVAADTLLRAPSGEENGSLIPALPGKVYSYEAESATVNHAAIISNTSASGGKKVGQMDYDDSFVEFDVNVPAGDYTMKVRYSNGMGEQASHHIQVNGEPFGQLIYESDGWDTWRDAPMDLHLNSGSNRIKISKHHLFTELDRIDLIPKKTKTFQYEAEHAYLNKADVVNDSESTNLQQVGNMTAQESHAVFPIQVSEPGTYKMKIRYKNADTASSTQKLFVNTDFRKTVEYQGSGQWGYTTVSLNLKKGKNMISFYKGKGVTALDHFTLEKVN
ncbi:family 43 glycosylhydrolase [Fictibacillus terranigra]|uniref:Family 43 glycosylhydrolase n=1 Tax=Fictibacillus terranigra TaxID=3058424 RepID=A0ABT8EBW2_9BACL|nr:family 43 glycosylhydrolase [Fictibacillus sp. CENA-BCM004]MDN4075385.1 family 43 glycosylhydrolase [Fictibacillus sp. CENA-BCM004]